MLSKTYIKSLLILLFAISFYSAKAQQDYFISKKGDTVKCVLEDKPFTMSGKMWYVASGTTKAKTLNLDTVFEYCSKSVIYTRRKLPGDSLL